jgi:hypothetical protein
MRQREFITLVGSTVVACPLVARAKALRLSIPQALLATAYEVLE